MANTLTNYQNSQAYKNAQAYQNQTMDQIAKKYGFDFSKGYADQQAETIASGQRNAQNAAKRENESSHSLNMQRILDDYNSSASGLDKGYFQQFLGQGQSQINRGLTGGMVADQNLRLAMNKQAELADLFRTRNSANQEETMRYSNTNQNILDALSQIEKERGMNAKNFYQDGLFKGYDVLSSDRNYGLQLDNSAWSKYMDGLNFDQRLKEAAAAKAAAAKAAAYRPSGSVTTPLTPKTPAYNAAKPKSTNIESYNKTNTPVPYNQQYLYKEYGLAPKSVANNSNISYWEKMKLLGG
jgi:hypothetical protein